MTVSGTGPAPTAEWPDEAIPGTDAPAEPCEPAVVDPMWDNRYRILRSLGSGGMGMVLLVEDTLQPGRILALKRHLPEFARDIPAFLREFRIHRQLAHPNIPRAFELGFAWDAGVFCPYITMEVSPGVALNELVGRFERGLPIRAAVEMAVGLLRALDHLHRQGFIHADLKPANLLVSERDGAFHCDLIDFGVALPRGRSLGEEFTATPEYAAPELLEGGLVDPRTDLYAVGLILYELLEGRRPWLESDIDLLWNARSREGPPALTSPNCTPELAALVVRLLSPTPANRPASAAETLAELSRIVTWDHEIEPLEAFVSRLLTVPLPWRGWLERLAAEVTEEPLMPGAPYAAIIDIPAGFFARRLLGPVLDEAAARRARVVPVRLDADGPDGGTAALLDYLERLERLERLDGLDAGELREDGDKVDGFGRMEATRERALVLVVENLDAVNDASIAALQRALRPSARLVATRRTAGPLPDFLRADEGDGPRQGVLHVALATWTEDEVRAWLHRALGRIGAPWERGDNGLPEPLTPAGIIETLATLYRDGHIVRTGDGYAWRERRLPARTGAETDEGGRASDGLDELLACIKTPVPERAIGAYLGGFVDSLGELVAKKMLVSRGDGTVEVGDEAKRATRYGRLAPSRRKALHRRLAQALEEAGATPHRISEEWLDSDAPLLAVPHLLAAAEARPGRFWLDRAQALVEHAKALVAQAGEGVNPGEDAGASARRPSGGVTGRLSGQALMRLPPLELWRYQALILATEARLMLACGLLDPRVLDTRIGALAELGSEHGHKSTLRVALELQVALAYVRQEWDGVVSGAQGLTDLDSAEGAGAAQARLHWARAMKLRAMGLPTEAYAELERGLELAQGLPRRAVWTPGSAFELVGVSQDVTLLLHESLAALCVDAHWHDLAEAACRAFLAASARSEKGLARARATWLEAVRLRGIGALDRALSLAEETAHTLPRERTPSLDGLLELELGWIRLELGDFLQALDHARFSTALAQDDRHRALEARAAMLEATARFYLGDAARASVRAQEAVRIGGAGADSNAMDARLLVLELALATQGFAMSDAVMREAAELGRRAQRRSERARAARAFRLAAEAAILRREDVLGPEWAQRALSELERIPGRFLHRPRHLVTAGRAELMAGRRDAAERLFAAARAEVVELSLRIDDGITREHWLAHPDQRGILGLSAMGFETREVGRPLTRRPRPVTGVERRPAVEPTSGAAAVVGPATRSGFRVELVLAPMRS